MSQENTPITTPEVITTTTAPASMVIDYDSRKKQLECEKIQMEKDKLELEIRNMRKPFKNPANIAPFTTLTAGFIALIGAGYSGFNKLSDDMAKSRAKADSTISSLADLTQKVIDNSNTGRIVDSLKDEIAISSSKHRSVEAAPAAEAPQIYTKAESKK